MARLRALNHANQEVVTGKRVNILSESPVDGAALLRIDSELRGVDRFRSSIVTANTRLSVEDSVLDTVTELISQAERAADLTNTDEDDPLRESSKREIATIREQIIDMANSQVTGEYIFSGTATDQPAFLDDGTYVGDSSARQFQIAENTNIEVNHTGEELFAGAIQALDALASALETGDGETIQSAMADLHDARVEVQARHGEVGSRLRNLDLMDRQLGQRASHLLDQKQAIDEVDPAESVLKLQAAANALERAYAAVSRVISTNITDYLR